MIFVDDSKIVEENLEDVSSEVTIVEGEFEDEVIKEQEETFKQMSPIRLIFRRFFRSKLSIVGLILIIVLFLFGFIGPLFLHMDRLNKIFQQYILKLLKQLTLQTKMVMFYILYMKLLQLKEI